MNCGLCRRAVGTAGLASPGEGACTGCHREPIPFIGSIGQLRFAMLQPSAPSAVFLRRAGLLLLVAGLSFVAPKTRFGPAQRSAAAEQSALRTREWVCVEGDSDRLLDQHLHSDMACAPTSALNAWLWGGSSARAAFGRLPGSSDAQKLDRLIARYGSRPSATYAEGARFRDTGVAPGDLLEWINEMQADHRLPELAGSFLDRSENEETRAHLERVHGLILESLGGGRGAIVRLRSFSEQRRPPDEKPLWHGLVGHWVLVTGVPKDLPPASQGFALEYIDPATGSRAWGYVHVAARDFTAAKGNAERWTWRENRAFLLAVVPAMSVLAVGEEPWHRRTVVTFDFAIGAFTVPDRDR